jgi:hypothetical protein
MGRPAALEPTSGHPARSTHMLRRFNKDMKLFTAVSCHNRGCSVARSLIGFGASLKIVPGNFEDPRVISMLRLHLQGMHARSPPGSVYALGLSGLKAPNISFVTAWEDEAFLGMGALKEIDATSAEIKSMRTDPKHLRKGLWMAHNPAELCRALAVGEHCCEF